jgi:outer membrane receptor for ferrienterochelin and colicin
MNFEAGVKGVWSSFVNDLDVENKISDTWIPDNSLSGKYDLSEQIAAAYVNINTSLGAQIECKAGLRYEHTWSLLNSEQVKGLIDRQYGSWFPSLFLSRKIDDKNHVNLAYSRRIRRQTFNDLAPFVLFMDPFSFWSGNERLLPSISDNISLSYKHRSILLILQYTYEDNAIMRYQGKIDAETNRMMLVSENLDYLRTLNATLTLPWTVNKYWDMQNNIQFNHRNAVFFFEGNGIFIEQNTYSINTTQRFKLPYQLSLELTGSYRSRELRGQFIALPYYGLNAGIQKKLPGEYGTIRFNVADVFDSFVFTTRNTLNDQGLSMDGHWDFLQRTYRLTYSRNLGRKGVKSSRKRAESEERTRVE